MSRRTRLTLLLAAGTIVLTHGRASAQYGPLFPGQAFGVGLEPQSVAIGDLNGDGQPDLATSSDKAGAISVLLHHGAGVFGDASFYGAGDAPESVALSDLNGDGKPDLATANYYGSVSVLLHK